MPPIRTFGRRALAWLVKYDNLFMRVSTVAGAIAGGYYGFSNALQQVLWPLVIRDIAAGLAAGAAAGYFSYRLLFAIVEQILDNLVLIGWTVSILAAVLLFGFLLG